MNLHRRGIFALTGAMCLLLALPAAALQRDLDALRGALKDPD